MMSSDEIRQTFLFFFKKKYHRIFPSAPIVLKNDPSLLFTNAGMNQFKDYFLGKKISTYFRLVNTQKCLRITGKHNDLDNVGHDTYHHTMFEMLGNWSFRDYFKKETILWAWEFLTDILKIYQDNIYVTIFNGDEENNIPPDEECYKYWVSIIGKKKILLSGKKDNFWEMGNTGPCGTCSEIHIDLRNSNDKYYISGIKLLNNNHPQVIELWNLVFLEYLRKLDKSIERLPYKYVDTGMGLERLCMVLQNKKSNYHTDIFIPLIREAEKVVSNSYGEEKQIDTAIRVIVDHIRAISFSIADGQFISNTGQGYVIRRLLRRAVSYGYLFLKQENPFIYKIVRILTVKMGKTFSELLINKQLIEQIIKYEEVSFFNTIQSGIKLIKHQIINDTIDEKEIFKLYDTFGLPIEISLSILRQYGLKINKEKLQNEMLIQKNRSRKYSKFHQYNNWITLINIDIEIFVGYDYLEYEIWISKYRINKTKYHFLFTCTPFYAEGGGQIGDSGYIENEEEKIMILDTKKENGLIIHITNEFPKNPKKKFKAIVDKKKRKSIENNHTAIHILHYSLINILGKHVLQKGSFISNKNLRFDFYHYENIKKEELLNIKNYVLDMIYKYLHLEEKRNVPIENAKGALIEDQYEPKVRCIKFGKFLELCGGTHVKHTGLIGFFQIISYYSIGSGIKRIVAYTSNEAIKYIHEIYNQYNIILSILHNTLHPIQTIKKIINENKKIRSEITQFMGQKKQFLIHEWKLRAKKQIYYTFIYEKTDLDQNTIKKISLELRKEIKNSFIIIANNVNTNQIFICIAISDELILTKKLNASKFIKLILHYMSVKGGGEPHIAFATCTNGLDNFLHIIKNYLK
jgi:alanyl-tRNA synthetase